MKKILIALPLVLIMILTMIPVMAADCEPVPVTVKVWVWDNPSEVDTTVTTGEAQSTTKTPSMKTLTDKAALEAYIKAEALTVEKPHDRVPADAWKAVIREKPPVSAIPATDDNNATCATQVIAEVDVFPNCETEEKPAESTTCPVLCDIITVKAVNVVDGETVASRGYGVKPNVAPSYKKMLDHFMAKEMPGNFKIVSNWFGQPWIDYPALLSNCELEIKVIPLLQQVNVIHKLYECCENLDGTKSYSLWKSFVEENVFVDFVDYHSKLVFDHSKAAEFATTRLERINAQDFVFIRAIFKDGINLDEYLTGELFDMDGKKIGSFKNDDPRPTIILEYHHVDCVEKAEEKVDNAQVNAGNATTNTPVTQQLPATGAKDVTAFFMSAVALLGLGIFFAKKR